MKKDDRLCIAITIMIIAFFVIGFLVFNEATLHHFIVALAMFGMCIAVFLPIYITHRVRTNAGVIEYQTEIDRLVRKHLNMLLEFIKAIKDSDIDEDKIDYLNQDRVIRLKNLASEMEDSKFKSDTVIQYLDAIKSEMYSIRSSLCEKYENIHLKDSGIPIPPQILRLIEISLRDKLQLTKLSSIQ